jgi:UDP-N-acetylmuramoyl-L-alanyl-D-glutamate--2,6-diaminopimelate ligase
VSNSHLAIAQIAANFFDNPSHQLQLVGITGTNGKTTVATLLFELFNQLGHNSGLISTVKVCTSLAVYPATHTTPDPITINRYLRQMVDEGCKYAFMEVSSHGLDQHRVSGLQFTGGIFTNITHDHLDYHLTFNNYIRAKKKLFDMLPAGAFALLNADDKHWQVMTEHCQAHVYTFALRTPADFKAKITEARLDGMLLNINNREFWARLIGGFNAYNLAAVYGAAILLGAEDMQTLSRLSAIGSVAGRFQHITRKNGTVGIVDYAHTPDALLNVLKTIEDVNGGGGNVITVIGCGGDRDKTKRPEMARIAAERSQKVIFTSDNPRSEDPEDILNDMEAGLEPTQRNKTLRITDRAQAIKAACQLAQPGDIILVAGKGHETYQEIKGVKHPFDDMQLLKEQFNIEQN